MHQYEKMKREGKMGMTDGPVTDAVAIARNSEFIMDSNVNNAKKCGRSAIVTSSWEQRLAIRYYNRLFKEYALVDLTYYIINKIGMRWRTEKEVIEGKGQFSCGNVHCDVANNHELCSFEVPFRYTNREGKPVSTLVKVRLCSACAWA